jgi:outer membrane protein OmpA-like peptidoglycan-associated protein
VEETIMERPTSDNIVSSGKILLVLLFLFWPAGLFAAGDYSYEIESPVQKGNTPKLVITPGEAWSEIQVDVLEDDARVSRKNVSKVKSGEHIEVPLEQSVGRHTYEIRLSAKTRGERFKSSFSVSAKTVPQLEVEVSKSESNIEAGRLVFTANRPVQRAVLRMESTESTSGGSVEETFDGESGRLTIEWEPRDLKRMSMKVWDVDGFWQSMNIEHVWVRIPHREVRFDFGKAKIRDKETKKLEKTLARIREELKKHSDTVFDMKLYIAGYTDTVGSKASNRQLSERRARAIAEWFQAKGLDVPIYYQGFGEDVLAVETKDDVRNKQNRRALYVLGSKTPPKSEAIPESDWERLQ